MISAELFKHWTYQVFAPGTLLRRKYNAFKELLGFDDACLDLIADIEEIAYGEVQADWARVVSLATDLEENIQGLMQCLGTMSPGRYPDLEEYARKVAFYVQMGLDLPDPECAPPHIVDLEAAADHKALAGGKAHNVALIAAETYLNVPPGFVVTSTAFNYFLEANGLRPILDDLLSSVTLEDHDRLEHLCADMQRVVRCGEVPEAFAGDILRRATELAGEGSLAVRSSAVAEDGQFSFAGQYESLLGVSADNVLDAYREIIASKYTPRAVAYRVMNGLADQETPMAVLFMPLVEARAAGVVYTQDLDRSQAVDGVLSVYAIAGVGEGLVSGTSRAQTWSFTREDDPLTLQEPDDEETVLTAEQALELARCAMELEQMFGEPQDVEWAMDREGQFVMLQSRPLQREFEPPQVRRSLPSATALIEGAARASFGVGSGPVFHLHPQTPLDAIPQNCVAVVAGLTPQLATVVDRFSGVVAELGSRASHFASVAREFALPVLIGVNEPFECLEEGTVVTVDADTGTVWQGTIPELAGRAEARQRRRRNPAMARLNKILARITKLGLTDPEAESFAPSGFQSLHDVVRFCHERAVGEMFSLVGKGGRGLTGAKKLDSALPLSMYILDVENGLFKAARSKKTVTPDDFKCQPMYYLWRGLSSPDILWDERLAHMDWEEFDRIAAGLFSHDDKALASYAVLAEDYMHLLVRFGYHFSVLDVLCTPDPKQNYLNFRFKGGGGSLEQRQLRLQFLVQVLAHYNFITFAKGDMLDARLCRRAEPEMLQKLFVLGRLLGKTRLMDMGLSGDGQIQELARLFVVETDRVARENSA